MSGHSKWSTIKHQKARNDAKRGQLFTKLTRELSVAARQGGGDPAMNFRLRLAMDNARQSNMPMDNVERAIQRATGAGDGGPALEEVIYEGYGPGGAAVMAIALTDNRNRTASEIRKSFDRQNSKLGQGGSVAWQFEQKGIITLDVEPERADELALQAIDLGADDFDLDGSTLELRCAPESFEELRRSLEGKGASLTTAEVNHVPKDPSHAERPRRRDDPAALGPPGGARRRAEGLHQRGLLRRGPGALPSRRLSQARPSDPHHRPLPPGLRLRS